MPNVVLMIHVPDIRAAIAWYQAHGFTLNGTHEDDGYMSWASMSYSDTGFMFNEGGHESDAHRREVDLYVTVDNVDELWQRWKDSDEVVEPIYDAIYGMREFIIRDLNRFWLTFGQPIEANQ